MAKDNISNPLSIYNIAYQDRFNKLKSDFDNAIDMALPERKINALNKFRNALLSLWSSRDLKLQARYSQLAAKFKDEIDKNNSWESLLTAWCKRKDVGKKIQKKFGIYMAESDFFDHISEKDIELEQNITPQIEMKDEATIRQQVLAMYYLLDEFKACTTDKTEIARFIKFLTGKEKNTEKITDTNIYKIVKTPFSMVVNRDLQFIRKYFEKMGMIEIVKKIEADMDKNNK